MAFLKRRLLPDAIKGKLAAANDIPTTYDDPLEVDVEIEPPLPSIAVPTGLSYEDDAARHLQLRFDDTVGFCRNCEGHFEMDSLHRFMDGTFQAVCPRCQRFLNKVGTEPIKTRHKGPGA